MHGGDKHLLPIHIDKILEARFPDKDLQIGIVAPAGIIHLKSLNQIDAQLYLRTVAVTVPQQLLSRLPQLIVKVCSTTLPTKRIHKKAQLQHLQQRKTLITLNQASREAPRRQQARHLQRLLIIGRQHTSTSLQIGPQYLLHHCRQKTPLFVTGHAYPPLLLPSGHYGQVLQAMGNLGDKSIGKGHQVGCAAKIIVELVLTRAHIFDEMLQMHRAGTTKGIDVLVVIAYGDDTQLLISFHQQTDQLILPGIHILRLINHQYRLVDAVGFNIVLPDLRNGLRNNGLRLLQSPHFTQQIETISVKSLYLNKSRGIAYERLQAGLKLRSGGTRKGQHQQLLVLYILHQQQGSQLMHQHLGLSAARTGSNRNVGRAAVFNHTQLGGRQAAKQLAKFGRRDVFRQLLLPTAVEILI